MIYCNSLAVFDLQLLGKNLVLNANCLNVLASTCYGVYGNLGNSTQVLDRATTLGMFTVCKYNLFAKFQGIWKLYVWFAHYANSYSMLWP